MKKSLLLGLVLATALAGCGRKAAAPVKTYLYCPVDTVWQSLPSYQITSNSRFPYGKFTPSERMTDAEWRDGMAVICLEIDRPVTVMVMPVRDSTTGMSWGDTFLLLPGDSLELMSETDTTMKGFTPLRPRLAETARMDNRCSSVLDAAFPYKDRPKVEDGDLMRYKADLAAYYQRKRDFLDSCRLQMTLSPEYLARCEALDKINFYNDLCSALDANPESEVPADFLGEMEISESVAGSAAYVTALVNKYMKHAVADPLEHFDQVYAGIRKAPRRLRDHLTTLMIGYYASEELPDYKPQLEAVIAEARGKIEDTVYLDYIDRAAKFYGRCGTSLPEEVLSMKLRPYDGGQELTLGEMLARFEGRPVYLDFWSSWCVGCILDIMNSAEAHEWLAQADVACVYLSLDEDSDAWRKAAAQYKVVDNSYLVEGEFDAPICKSFEINSIPRYILLDKAHRIASSDAPRPVKYGMADLKRVVGRVQ